MLRYGIAGSDLARYLAWFHGVHVPEKLARPGYTWAAHYRLQEADPVTGASGFIALFGGETTRVFLDPSPAQLKVRQDAETLAMMALRIDNRATVYCEEWQIRGAGSASRRGGDVLAPALCFEGFEANGHDEDLAAWCAQEHMPNLGGAAGAIASRKLLACAGGPRHALLHEFRDVVAAAAALDTEEGSDWRARVESRVQRCPPGPRLAQRIWPAVD
jgi:hypothetical protein